MSDTKSGQQAAGGYDFSAADYRALTDPDNLAAFRAFRHWARSTKQAWVTTTGQRVGAYAALGLMFAVICVLFGTILGNIAGHLSGSESVRVVVSFLPVTVLVVMLVGGIIVGRRKSKIGGQWEARYRSHHFAAANDFEWRLESKAPAYPGNAFKIGREHTAYEHFIARSGRFLDIGNVRFVTGSGKSSTTHRWGYMALKLDRRIPHCVVDAHSNNSAFGSNMQTFGKDQILHLEGDFDRYFTLYCPREYEQDALYIFTPDLMALLIDTVSAFDVEIVDDWMFVYSTKPWPLQDASTWYRLFLIVHTVGRKALASTSYYRDERALPARPSGATPGAPSATNNFVAPEGQRLRKGFNWKALSTFGLIMLAFAAVAVTVVLVSGGNS